MRNYLKEVLVVIIFATLWFGSGYLLLIATSIFAPWAVQGGLINLLLVLTIIALLTRTETGRKLLYQGPDDHEEDNLTGLKFLIFLLVGVPIVCFFFGAIWWLFFAILRLIGLGN